MTKIKTKFKCKNYRPGYMPCEVCVHDKEYIVLQNANCVSCFEPLIETNK